MAEPDFSHEEKEGVLIQDITDWDGDPDQTDEFESEWIDRAQASGITGAVTEFGDDILVDDETKDHFAEIWGDAADDVNIKRLALVAPGITSRAIGANIDSNVVDIRSFSDVDKAFNWASDI
ncbi:hypothetical protein EXE49_07225 [Halorubrum sp. ASP121]|uniref:hypothetical protein n=1 Tax=Halorubrum sp. ASP121 TaxID=1855858 RepID=UPI0010F6F750|nr:hypothetical protein [Halorubrum sp. ASP121]TKX50368.1 hypothetical protein EXE49_07225 [Halorubrum sp. ASP121]